VKKVVQDLARDLLSMLVERTRSISCIQQGGAAAAFGGGSAESTKKTLVVCRTRKRPHVV
jgi:hypothetical protein